MEDLLFVKTFGGFSIEYKGITISDQDNRSKKLWTLIEYIMINHKNDLTITSMIELLWPNDTDSASPMNALKVCLHRSREILNRLNYPAKDLIVHKHNSVFWNKNIPLQLDCEQFEYYCKQAEQTILSADEKINLYEKAFALYHGDFLPKNCEDDWVLPITSYYHTLYITSVQKFLSILYTNHYYEKMVTYAYQAARIEEYNENIQYYLILGLHCSGNNQAALSQYEHIIKLLYNDFGVNPSEDLKQLYLRIIKENNTSETDLNIIQQTLKEKETQPRSYECDYAIFEHLYQIQARSMERTGLTFFLCLITLTPKTTSSKKDFTSEAMKYLSDILATSLRSGDVFSRYSTNQYIILLPSASYENAMIVGERIVRKFDSNKIKSKVEIGYKLKCMEPKTF